MFLFNVLTKCDLSIYQCSFNVCWTVRKRFGECHLPRIVIQQKSKKYCENSHDLWIWDTSKEEVKGFLSKGCSYPWLPFLALTQGFGQGRGEGCLDTMWMKKMGGASDAMHSMKQLVGGREERRERKVGLLLKGIQVLLCNTSHLRTSGKSMYLCTLSLRIVVWAHGFFLHLEKCL